MTASFNAPPGFDELPIEEKIAYVQALWGWQEAVIAQRLTETRSSSARVRSWSDVRAEVWARLQSHRK